MELFSHKEQNQGKGDSQPAKKGFDLNILQSHKSDKTQFNPALLSNDLNALSRKIRLDEERTLGIRRKLQMIEHNMVTGHKKLLTEIKFINQELSEMKRGMDEYKSKLLQFGKELERNARKEDVDVLQRYINMWEPVNFVTRKEVEKIIGEKLRELHNT